MSLSGAIASIEALIASSAGALPVSIHFSHPLIIEQNLIEQNLIGQSLIGQCRQLNRIERIYSAGDLASDRVSDLPSGTRITLASEVNQPTVGWVRISYPVTGYIQTAFLVPCGTEAATANPRPTPRSAPTTVTPQSCGVGIPPLLTVRSGPGTTFPPLLDLSQEQSFRLLGASQTQTQPTSEQGRIWVQIERSGLTGWVAATGPQGLGSNVQRISCDQGQLP